MSPQFICNLSLCRLFCSVRLLPILANNKNEIFEISSSATKFFECNYEEGNTRIIFHALQQKANVAVYSEDTDVLVLMVFAYALNKINEK